MRTLATVTLTVLLGISHVLRHAAALDHDVTPHWCHDDHVPLDAFDVVKTYMNITSEDLRAVDLNDVIAHVFTRVKCDTIGGNACDNCLTAENIYNVLDLGASVAMSEPQFKEACTIITAFIYHLTDMCQWVTSVNWDSLTYTNFTNIIFSFESDHDHVTGSVPVKGSPMAAEERFFTSHQLEYMMREINDTYRPGSIVYGANGSITEPDFDVVCSQAEQASFRSRDVMEDTERHAPALGVAEDELADMAASLVARLLRGDCMDRDRREDDGLPDEEDFISVIFVEFAENDTCTIGREGYEAILASLAIGEATVDHDDHGRAENLDSARDDVIHRPQTRPPAGTPSRVKRADDHNHDDDDAGVSTTCYSSDDMLNTLYMDATQVAIGHDDFVRLCPLMLQQATQGCLATDSVQPTNQPTKAETYGYGTAAIFIISACAVFGLVLGAGKQNPCYRYVIATMLGLATGSLVGDTFLHLIPQSLGLHSHGADDGHDHGDEGFVIQSYVWKMLVTSGAIWAYIALQMLLQHFGDDKDSEGKKNVYVVEVDLGRTNPAYVPNSVEIVMDNKQDDVKQQEIASGQDDVSTRGSLDINTSGSVAWMVTIGDLIHNVADGLTVGAAFTLSWNSGLASSIAVFCHELPHEFGDVAILLSAGWSLKKTALFQVVSAASAFIGLYIGIPVAQTETAREWIFALASGMFLYVALSDVIPEVMELFKGRHPWKIFAAVHCGIFLGVTCMFLIAIFEDYIII